MSSAVSWSRAGCLGCSSIRRKRYRILSDAIITEELYYVICAILSFLVLFWIYLMSKVEKAPLGNALSATALARHHSDLVHKEILTVWCFTRARPGRMHRPDPCAPCQMIEIPQLVGLLNGVGGELPRLLGSLPTLRPGLFFKSDGFACVCGRNGDPPREPGRRGNCINFSRKTPRSSHAYPSHRFS